VNKNTVAILVLVSPTHTLERWWNSQISKLPPKRQLFFTR